ncbi:hypothetical protein LO772_14355 [Yinghuangia sp. ASG 101]|uniref:hypothetical protein n=1 Tax=Yinghuangia sp. ASG 101 TaxID=2896848 RepID=UPI001E43E9E9|nr:hypothetical protein [Yinghuangia sp. ASG 101]UGQ14660.1 hypothetical protein LO772_14355 [Yinghuangia sp. ASG 101]
MPSVRRSKLAVVAAVLSGAAFLTACQSDDSDTKSAATPSADAPTAAASGQPSSAGDKAGATGRPASDASTPAKGGTAKDGTTAPTGGGDTRSSTVEDLDNGKGVNGTWFGTVKYLAPGKYTVSDMKGVEQQFLVAEDTEIWGAGDICGDAEGQSATKCTEAELEAATQGAGVSAEVVVANGIATTITDDH